MAQSMRGTCGFITVFYFKKEKESFRKQSDGKSSVAEIKAYKERSFERFAAL